MSDYETTRRIRIKIEIINYDPGRPATRQDPEEPEELEYKAYYAVRLKGVDVLTEVPEDICESLSLRSEVIDYIKDREDCMRGREDYDSLDGASKAFYKIM